MTVALSPSYSTTPTNWTIGPLSGAGAGAIARMEGSDSRWEVHSMRLRLAPGTYTLKTFSASVLYANTSYCDAMRFVIWGGDTTAVAPVTLSNGLTYIDLAAYQPAGAGSAAITATLGDVTFTVQAGVDYWYSIVWHGIAGRASYGPSIRTMNTDQWVPGDYWHGEIEGATPPADSTGLTYQDSTGGLQRRMSLKVATTKRKLFSIDADAYTGTAMEIIIPRNSDTTVLPTWIKLGSCVVADGQALTVVVEGEHADTQATETAAATLVLDMGATDQITFGGANVALAAAGAEAGDTFDIAINLRGATGKCDVFYKNRTTGQGAEGATDVCTISHAAKNNAAGTGARGQSYTLAAPANSIKISGTATIETIEVGYEMLVMFGDSQATYYEYRLGGTIPNAFSEPHISWDAAIAGSKLTTTDTGTQTAAYLRYKHTTNGLGDLCEMRGTVFIVAGIGFNDINARIGAIYDSRRNQVVQEMLGRLANILQDNAENGNQAIIIGLPPYTNADPPVAPTIKTQWNVGLEGLAIANRCAFVNPWFDMVTPGTENDTVPAFNPTYCNEDTIHYAQAGSDIVAALVAQAYESNQVGGPWTKRSTRGRRPGMLLPI